MSDQRDIIIIGAGAAGMNAAYVAAEPGLAVTVVDANPCPGGQYHRRGALEQRYRPSGCSDENRWARVEILSGQQVYAVNSMPDTGHVLVRMRGDERHPHEIGILRARALIVTTGAMDRQLAIPGWQLPGVMAGGGAQSLIKGSGVLPGQRTLVTGTGPFLLAVAASIVQAGGEVAAVIEANAPAGLARHTRKMFPAAVAKTAEAARFAGILARHRVPYLTRRRVTRIAAGAVDTQGRACVSEATVQRIDSQWQPKPGTEQRFDVDCVTLGFGFTAQLDLLLQLGCAITDAPDGGLAVLVDERQATSRPSVFAAGETTGIGGVDLASVEGRVAGLHAAAELTGRAPATALVKSLHRQRRHLHGFATALALAFPVPTQWVNDQPGETIVCRCEEITLGDIRSARDDLGATDPRSIKLLTRAGMGWCQGRMCSFSVEGICGRQANVAAQAASASRPVSVPVPLGAIARDENVMRESAQ